ncbi:hypothetical protein [Mycolicibacterium sp.]|uniref:hypothetical protein n=1 Tax=Mycolicibacterium sp. TaxID=2320850 RepID=UPI001A2CBD20|nr:hypothetical protein [Mycolicibacterium sp.]MBJ7338662.1 hypothetical protein [Mycolicibacterium sp.]
MSSADTPTSTRNSNDANGFDKGRRGLLMASAAAVGAGVAAAATSCSRTDPSSVEVEVSARSVLAKLSADGDPKANTDALNAAIVESTKVGADVVLPGGEYGFLGMTLPTTGRVNVRGSGRGVTTLRNEGTEPSITAHGVPGGNEYLSDWAISGLTITATTKQPALVGVSVKLASRFSVSDISLFGHGIGIRHESGWDGGYDGVSVGQSGTAWLFPRSDFAPTSPLGLRNCSAWDCDTAVIVENGVETLEWVGGDFSGCGRGMLLYGNETRSISLHGINFERIRGEDLLVGDGETGPASVTLNGCRFLRVAKGPVSVRFVRGDAVTVNSSRWTNYQTAIDQGPDSGQLVVNTSTGFEVDRFIAANGGVQTQAVLNASAGARSLRLALDGPSIFPAVIGAEGVGTKVISGPGRVTASDRDFAVPPTVGCTCVLRNETDGTVRHAIRGVTGWFVSAPYQAPPRP